MKGKDVEPGTPIMALDCKRPSDMLHCEIIANGSTPIPNEIKCCRETTTGKKVMKEVIKSPLDLLCYRH